MNQPQIEIAASQRGSRTLERCVTALRRLVTTDPCARCGTAAVVAVSGAGVGWCARCSELELTERREGLARRAEARRQLDAVRAGR